MVLVFSISDTRLCQTFKVFSRKRLGAGKTTNLPPANTYANEGTHIPSDPEPTTIVQSCKGKMTLLGSGF